jgi:glutamyl-tRNA synthetase
VYGKWAKSRDLDINEVKARIASGGEYVIRLKSSGNFENKIKFNDEMMGDLELSENDEDFVLAKKDGVPTYHLAHLIDDYLMRITYVIRANEWVASITKHLELWKKLGVNPPKYGHIMPINKKDGNSVRKLSKRKDPEAGVQYFVDQGYPVKALKSYLIRLAAPSFDEFWLAGNRDVDMFELNLDELKRNSRGPIFDFTKLNSLSSDLIASMRADEVLSQVLEWTEINDQEFNSILAKDTEYSRSILNIERSEDVHATNARKDIAKWSDVRESVFYFFDELFEKEKLNIDLSEINNFRKEISELLNDDQLYNANTTLDQWVNLIIINSPNFTSVF